MTISPIFNESRSTHIWMLRNNTFNFRVFIYFHLKEIVSSCLYISY